MSNSRSDLCALARGSDFAMCKSSILHTLNRVKERSGEAIAESSDGFAVTLQHMAATMSTLGTVMYVSSHFHFDRH